MTLHQVRHGVGRASFIGAILAAALLAQPVSAMPLLFTFAGGENGSFQVDSNPTPNYLDASSFGTPVTGAAGDFAGAGGVEFYLPSGGGGLATYVGPGNSVFIGLDGPQLFTGTLTNPVFAPGKFALTSSGGVVATSLVITGPGAPVPELGSGWLATVGVIAALAAARRRRLFAGSPVQP